MKDCQRLRLRIQSLLGVTLVGVCTPACEGDAGQVPVIKEPPRKPVAVQAPPVAKPAKIPLKNAVATPPPAARAPLPGYQLGDPPFVEGWDPEEATCVSGNWCGPATAAAVVVRVGMEDELDPETGCPLRLMGKKEGGIDASKAVYKGLSADRMMRGTFQSWRTAQTRKTAKGQALCCYHWFDYCAGRPLDQGERTRAGRLSDDRLTSCDAQARARALAYWQDADDEYDSVAAFARASLELFALGAPAGLIEASQRASLDELEHARLCRDLSQELYPHTWPQREPVFAAPREPSLERFILDTFREGCVGESIASLRATRMAKKSSHEKEKAVLERIADEEAEHAALAFRIVAWGLSQGGAELVQQLQSQAQTLRAEIHSAARGPDAEESRLSPQELRACAGDAWEGVIAPMLARLL